eukprot:TRINITY_DN24382_c0_g2_i1.p1 TRINITY_DN24382_c0_g2~~TRINITY_DN24382_c0_g2_i1.p1  ORF type:complete len:451 (+),score=66.25 TRINITY_DN24382_c0_g2_i1:58-1410(+)
MSDDESSGDQLSSPIPNERLQSGSAPASQLPQAEPIIRFFPPCQDTDNPESLRRFTVRCEGRWNLRDAPTFISNTLGTIAAGTIVVGEDSRTDGLAGVSCSPTSAEELHDVHPAEVVQAMQSITSLWVRVVRIELQEPSGIEIKHDFSDSPQLYCLRRNDEGHGLYDSSVEPLEGPFIQLPDHLHVELRLDAARLKAHKAKEVSLTWMLFDAAGCLGNLFSPPAIDNATISENIEAVRESPITDIFEERQQEQIKKAASSVRAPLEKLIAQAIHDGNVYSDLLAGLQGEIRRRFARLRVSLANAADASLVSMDAQAEQSDADGSGPLVEGSAAELGEFVHLCERLERTGGPCWLNQELRTEVMSFSLKHAHDLHDYAKTYGKNPKKAMEASSPSHGSLARTPSRSVQSPTWTPDSFAGDIAATPPPEARFLPFIPPPPASGCSVGKVSRV